MTAVISLKNKVAPIERMIFLLSMLRKDPLGYENTPQYNDFISEGREDTYNSFWTAEVLKGTKITIFCSSLTIFVNSSDVF